MLEFAYEKWVARLCLDGQMGRVELLGGKKCSLRAEVFCSLSSEKGDEGAKDRGGSLIHAAYPPMWKAFLQPSRPWSIPNCFHTVCIVYRIKDADLMTTSMNVLCTERTSFLSEPAPSGASSAFSLACSFSSAASSVFFSPSSPPSFLASWRRRLFLKMRRGANAS